MKSEPAVKKIKLSNESEDFSSDIDDPDEIESLNENDAEKIEEIESLNESDVEKIEENETVVRSAPNANFFHEELTSDDEILTFQCPKNFNINLLLNESLSPNKVTTIEDNENKYNCSVLPNTRQQITCILPRKKGNATIVNLPVAGHIVVKKEFKFPTIEDCAEEDDDDEIDPDSESEDETVRHPLLGNDYEEHLKTVTEHMQKYKKLLKKSMKHEKSLEKAEKERKEQKKKLKVELSLLKKHRNLNESSTSIH